MLFSIITMLVIALVVYNLTGRKPLTTLTILIGVALLLSAVYVVAYGIGVAVSNLGGF